MADNATSPFGVVIGTGTYTAGSETPPGSYTDFGQLIDVQLPGMDVKEVKATHLNQADRFDRFKQGFVNAGEVAFTIHFDKTSYNTILTSIAAATEFWVRVEIPEPDNATHVSEWEAHGFWKGAPVEIPNSESTDGITCKVTFKVNGKPQFTAYSA